MSLARCSRSAALLALLSGGPCLGQFTTNGTIDASEQPLYVQRWVQLTPTLFGDNFDGAGAGAAGLGNPAVVTTGIELAIPFSALGTITTPYTGGSIRIAAILLAGDVGSVSNQVLGGIPLNMGGLGDPRLLNFNAVGSAGNAQNQFLGAFTPFAAGSNPIIDGTQDASIYGPSRGTQTNYTNYGNATHGALIVRPDPTTNEGSELDNLRCAKRGTTLYIFIGGNLEANFNKVDIFIDSIAGGQPRLLPATNAVQPGDAWINRLADDGSGNGLTFDIGFEPDFAVRVNGGNTAGVGLPAVYKIFLDSATLPTGGAGLASYQGETTYGSNGVTTGGDIGAPAIAATINNANIQGVIGEEVGGANAAPNVDRAYGSEMDGVYSYLDAPNNRLHVLVAGNIQINFNKYDLFFDCAPGGQNRLRGASQEVLTPSGNVQYSGNGGIDFNGLNRMGADMLVQSDPMNELSERLPVNGLVFDAGFEADYWLSFTNGLISGLPAQFINAAPLRTGGVSRSFVGAPQDFSTFDGGNKAMNNPILMDGDGMGGGYTPLTGFEAFSFDPQGQFAPRHLGVEMIPGLPAPTPGLISATIDNSNVLGVTGLSGAGGGSVITGVEFSIDVRELGWDGVSPIRLGGFVNGSGHDFVSNQVIGGLPTGPMAGGGYDDRNIGEPRTVNLSAIAGDQFILLTGGVTPRCPGDYNGMDGVNPDDLADYINDYFDGAGAQPGFASPISIPATAYPLRVQTVHFSTAITSDLAIVV